MDTSPVKLPTHKHPLHRSSRFIHDEYCDGCLKKGPINEGYRCNDSECSHVWFHKECAESPPTLLNHSSHRQHPLILTQFKDYNSACDLCGNMLATFGHSSHGLHSTSGYHCSVCDFKVDLECGRKPRPLIISYLMFHDHPLVMDSRSCIWWADCGVCKVHTMNKLSYRCVNSCSVYFHEECVNLGQEVNHLYHSNHPLRLVKLESLSTSVVKTCVLCGAESEVLFYHCSICNFSLCLFCKTSPPRLSIEHRKTHEHQFFLMPARVSFTCNVCGMQGNQSPYLCLQCGFSVHRGCVDLPRVININRHDHRISLIHQLGLGYSSCGVCHKDIEKYYGGYACSVCPKYAVHSQCAVRTDVWEGIELENIPEEIEDVAPFVVVGDNLIKHFSHKHNLRFSMSTIFQDESTKCKECVRPVYDDPFYKCEHCDFNLHEKCANLPRRKRLVYSNKPFTLVATNVYSGNHFWCSSCGIISSGFRYVSGDLELDIFCGSFSEPFMHDGHTHPLYYNTNKDHTSKCSACLEEIHEKALLHCNTCEFRLHFRCANMPNKVKSRYDDHPLFLCYGEKSSGKYWCDICEEETDPSKWFYTCSYCGVALHVECVLGDFSHLMPGSIIKRSRMKFEVVSNTQNSCRPFCVACKLRCRFPHILRFGDEYHRYICSKRCLTFVDCGQRLIAVHREALMLRGEFLEKHKSVA